MENIAVLVVDMQKGLCNEHPFMEEQLISNIKNLIDTARQKEQSVLYVCHDGGKGDDLEKGTIGFEVIDALAPKPTEVIFTKERNSSFYQTKLKEYLIEQNIDSLIVCGMQTDFCIDATVKAGFEHGFHMYVLKDGTSTFDNHFFHANETISYYEDFIWNNRYAKVLSADFVQELLQKNSDKTE